MVQIRKVLPWPREEMKLEGRRMGLASSASTGKMAEHSAEGCACLPLAASPGDGLGEAAE